MVHDQGRCFGQRVNMNIGIDISALSNRHNTRGTGSYTRLLIDALQTYEKHHTFHLLSKNQEVPKHIDIIHYPYFDPFFLTLPLFKPVPVVVTVHDLIPIVYADHFPRGLRGEIKWQVQKYSLTNARQIITDSMASKADIIDRIHLTGDKINVIYLAADDIYKKLPSSSSQKQITNKYRLPARYLLYVGDVNWNKNILGLLHAIRLTHSDLPLVLVGSALLNSSLPEVREINNLIESLKIGDRIVRVGYVPDIDLVSIYTMAAVYIQPSFAEGFGLPVLEAMSCGCPIVSSFASSLKEIAGPSILVDPQRPDKIAEGIDMALTIDRKEWVKQANNWLANFSLKTFASQTMDVYQKALV